MNSESKPPRPSRRGRVHRTRRSHLNETRLGLASPVPTQRNRALTIEYARWRSSAEPDGRFAELAHVTEIVAAMLVRLDDSTAEAVADERGWTFRVVRRDGVSLPVTMDLRSNRIDATVESGRVTAVVVG